MANTTLRNLRVLVFTLFTFPAALFAATNQWTGAGGDGLWSNTANWSLGTVPSFPDDVLIDLPGTYTVTVDTFTTVATLTVGAATGTQTLDVNNNYLTSYGEMVVSETAVLKLGSGNVSTF